MPEPIGQRPSMLPETTLEKAMKPEAPLVKALQESLTSSPQTANFGPQNRDKANGNNVDEKG